MPLDFNRRVWPVGRMRFVHLIAASPLLTLIACSPVMLDEDEPVAEVEQAATCLPSLACDGQGPCTCPNGFTCAYGVCTRTVDPWQECFSDNDCVTTSPSYAGSCWRPICYFYFNAASGDNESGCGWQPRRPGFACTKIGGGNGVCGVGPTEAECH